MALERLYFAPRLDRVFVVYDAPSTDAEIWSSPSDVSRFELLGTFDSWRGGIAEIPSGVIFTASSSEATIWRTDGSREGTVPLAGLPRSIGIGPVVSEGLAYFTSHEDEDAIDVWRTDGTPGGTFPVVDGNEHLPTFFVDVVAAPSGALVTFVASDFSFELVATDGTPEGSRSLSRFGLGRDPIAPLHFRSVQGRFVLFSADDGVHGREPWRTDGTHEGTTLLADLCPGACGSNPTFRFVGSNSHEETFFVAETPAVGRELYRTDGTPGGTTIVADLCPGECSSGSSGAIELSQTTIFLGSASDVREIADIELWEVAGPGTQPVKVSDFAERALDGFYWLVQPDGTMLFTRSHGTIGSSIWRTRGASTGVSLVDRFVPMSSLSGAGRFGEYAGRLLLATHGPESARIWTSDGTREGTRSILEIADLEIDSQGFVDGNDQIFFVAEHRQDRTRGLWVMDAAGERAQSLLQSGVRDMLGFVRPFLVFSNGSALWRSDGTVTGTVPLLPGLEVLHSIGVLDRSVLFTALHGEGLWSTDGTEHGTLRLRERLTYVSQLATLGSHTAVFAATGDDGVKGLWKTDGTSQGTLFLKALPGIRSTAISFGDSAVVLQRKYGASTLWRTDGTEEGTVAVYEVDHELDGIAAAGPYFYFYGKEGGALTELWSSDGTAAGTRLVLKTPKLPGPTYEPSFADVDGHLVFSAGDDDHGTEIWRSNGMPIGTRRVFDVAPGVVSSNPSQFTRVGDLVFFAATDANVGRELWAVSVRDLLSWEGPVPQEVRLTKTVEGEFEVGGRIRFVIRIENLAPLSHPDLPGDELVDVLPDGLRLLDARADNGLVRAFPETNTVLWSGSVPPQSSLEVTIDAEIARRGQFSNQAELFLDRDHDGLFDASALSDSGTGGPTTFSVGAPTAIPALTTLGSLIFVLSLSIVAVRRLLVV